jgi:hypothetical protein
VGTGCISYRAGGDRTDQGLFSHERMAIGSNSIPNPWHGYYYLEANMQGAKIYILALTFWNSA